MKNSRKALYPFNFFIGLLVSLALVLVSFEWKYYTWIDSIEWKLELEPIEDDIIPIVMIDLKTPPPPPPPSKKTSLEIKIVDHDPIEPIKKEKVVKIEKEIPMVPIIPLDEPIEDDAPVYNADRMPSFPGGTDALYQYLSHSIKYPRLAVENGIQGRVYIEFVVEKDGSISNIEVKKSPDASGLLEKEALRVISQMPQWIPGMTKGKRQRVRMTLPVLFTLRN